jgi:hypothetical protein
MRRSPLLLLLLFACSDDPLSSAAATIEVKPLALDFGPVPLGLPVSLQLEVRNLGRQELLLQPMTPSLPDYAGLTSALKLAAGERQVLAITFTPTVTGERTGVVRLPSNAGNDPDLTIAVTGQGTPRLVCADCSSPPPSYCASPRELITYEPHGTCVSNKCEYQAARVACGGGCVAARAQCIDVTGVGPDAGSDGGNPGLDAGVDAGPDAGSDGGNPGLDAGVDAGCTLPWGGTLAHGHSTEAFLSGSVPCSGTCAREVRTCTHGSLSGSFGSSSCAVASCASCTLPWGGTIAHGASVTAYQSPSVPASSSCVSESRSCNNGSLSGSYTFASCSVRPSTSCPSQTLTWDGFCLNGVCYPAGTGCSGSVTGASHGASSVVKNTVIAKAGLAQFDCDNGVWVKSTGAGNSSGVVCNDYCPADGAHYEINTVRETGGVWSSCQGLQTWKPMTRTGPLSPSCVWGSYNYGYNSASGTPACSYYLGQAYKCTSAGWVAVASCILN